MNGINIPTPDAACECGFDEFRIETLLAMTATISLCFTVSTGEVTAGWACRRCRKSVLVTKRPDSPKDGGA